MTDRTHRHHWWQRLFGRARLVLERAWDEIYRDTGLPAPDRAPEAVPDDGNQPGPEPEILGPEPEIEADADAELAWHERANFGNWHYPKDEAAAEATAQDAAIEQALAARDTDADIEADIEEIRADDGLDFHGPLEEDEARIQELSDALDAERAAEERTEQLAQEEPDLADTRDWVRDVAVERVYADGVPDGMTLDEAIDNEVAVMYEEDQRRIEAGERALFTDQPDPGPAAEVDDGPSLDAARWTPDLADMNEADAAEEAEIEARNEADWWGEQAIAWRERPGGEAEYEADAGDDPWEAEEARTTPWCSPAYDRWIDERAAEYEAQAEADAEAQARAETSTDRVLTQIDEVLAENDAEAEMEVPF